MRRIPIEAVREGQVIAKNIYDENGYMLLARGTSLTEYIIDKLKRVGYLSLFIDDGFGDVPREEAVDERKVIALQKATKSIFKQPCRSISAAQMKQLSNLVDMIIEELVNATVETADDILQLNQVDDETFTHSVNVMMLTILMGKKIYGLRSAKMKKLAMGALLHDYGKLFIPPHVLKKKGALSTEEYEEVKNHTLKGFDYLKTVEMLEPTVRIVALEHHERYDGTGYPQQKAGDSIHEFSAITSLCDVYEALTADRVYRKGFPVNEAYEYLSGAGGTHFDYRWVKLFLSLIYPYPTGTQVLLSNDLIGKVVNIIDPYRLRPVVELENQYVLDLTKHHQITVQQVIY